MKLNKDYIKNRFGKIVIWGMKTKNKSTFRYIFEAYDSIFRKLDIPFIWCDNEKRNNGLIERNNLVLDVDICCNELEYKTDAFYCLLNCGIDSAQEQGASRWLNLRVFGEGGSTQIGVCLNSTTIYNKCDKILYQPWATDLLPCEFFNPVYKPCSNTVYWVGSIWNDKNNHGNLNEISELKKALKENNLNFVHLSGIEAKDAVLYIQKSRIAPCIGGRIQVERNMMPCRFWKVVSYGQLGFSNIPIFQQIFNGCILSCSSISNMVEKALRLSEKEYKEMIKNQQEIVKKDHTYLNRFETLFNILEDLYI